MVEQEIAIKIKQKVDDLNKALAEASRQGVVVDIDTLERGMIGEPSFPILSVRIYKVL